MSPLICILILTGCAATGPALDEWDIEESESKINVGALLNKSDTEEQSIEQNAALEQRIEKLENQTEAKPEPETAAAGVEATPSSDNASYQEWLQHKSDNSEEYKEFLEYKKWQEFQAQKKTTGATE